MHTNAHAGGEMSHMGAIDMGQQSHPCGVLCLHTIGLVLREADVSGTRAATLLALRKGWLLSHESECAVDEL